MPLPFRTPQFSSGISSQFKPDVVQVYGNNDPISCMYYDPVQSLYIVGTLNGRVHVYGKSNSKHSFSVQLKEQINVVFLVKTVYLLAIDKSNYLTIWDLETSEKWAQYHIPSPVVSYYIDPALDWLFIGQRNGQTSVFDIDRGIISQFLVENIQLQVLPAARLGGVNSVELHPKDVSQILLCYSDMFAVFSVTTNTILFHTKAKDKLQFAKWAPAGTHIMTGSENNLSFYDGYSGRFLSARPSVHNSKPLWCSTEHIDDTFIVYAEQNKLIKVKFGVTPTYSLTSWDAFGKFFGTAKQQEVSFDYQVEEITPTCQTPFFGGGHNPSHLIVRLKDGSLHTLKQSLRSAFAGPVLPQDLCFSANKISCLELGSVPRLTWSGMMIASPKPLVRGGSLNNVASRLANTSVTLCGYIDGSIRLFSEVTGEETRVIETNIAEAAPGPITKLSLSESASELAVAVFSGAVVLLGFQRNNHGIEGLDLKNPEIHNVSHTSSSDIKEGFLPLWVISARGDETVSALCQSDIGFVGIGYSSGRIALVDKRGPAIILDEALPAVPTSIAFGIQEFLQDGYSSILMSVGTSQGHIVLYKVIPRPQGGFQAVRATEYTLGKEPVAFLTHIDIANGRHAAASREVMAQLARGIQVAGGLIACSADDARIFGVSGNKPKLAHKRLDRSAGSGFACLREGDALGLITVSQRGKMAAYGIPSLSSLFGYEIPFTPTSNCHVSLNGNILVPLGALAGLVRIWGVGQSPQPDAMYTRSLKIPHRPEISSVEWVSGRQYVRLSDFDDLMSGSRRPRAKKERDVFQKDVVEPARAKSPKQKGGWFEQAHPHSYASAAPTVTKTWGQTFDEYYDSAAGAVNGAMDDMIDNVKTTQKNATRDIAKGIISSKLGL